MNYKAIFFDAGDTLLSPHPSFQEIFCGVVKGFGHDVSVSSVTEAFDAIGPSFAQALENVGTAGWTTSREISFTFWSKVYNLAFDHLEISADRDQLCESLYETFTRYESYRLFPDSLPTLQALKESGVVVGLISNFEEWLEGMLIEMEVAELFDVVVISGKEGIEKPHSGIFELALSRAGVEAADSVYVGDSIRSDVEGSSAIGMTPVLIDRRGVHGSFDGHRIETLDELSDLLASI